MKYFRHLRNSKRFALLLAALCFAIIGVATTIAITRGFGFSGEPAIQVQAIHVDQLAKLARDGGVKNIVLDGDIATASLTDGSAVVTRKEPQSSLIETLRGYGVPDSRLREISLEVKDPVTASSPSGPWAIVLVTAVSVVFLVGLVFILSKSGGAGRYGSFTKSSAKMFGRSRSERAADAPAVTFDEVAGVDEAKQELSEVVDFLKYPDKFAALGARIPKGVLLVGPPGTGKTLLAKAVAGEAGVPFLSISGSEFVEMFVGVGASRVRDLFGRARRAAPCIVFIDEIDAVGRHRNGGARGHGGNDEREQTLNQILVEMDGFDGRTGVVVIAATNRPDVLDEALLRPGRFDRQVMLDTPDIKGRKAILAIHSRGKPLARNVDLETVARQTPGFSGADLSNLMNEAAILAARRGKRSIGQGEIEEAVDRVIAGGPQKKSRVISQRERRITAYHEVGHALVATALPNCDPVHKVTIIGRGRAGGFTRFLPAEDRSLWARSQFLDTLASMLGGHAAEELVFGEVTTGASNDIERATELAQRMVCQYGMSERFGPLALGRAEPGSRVGRGAFEQKAFSDEMAREIDMEIRQLIDDARATAKAVLTGHRDRLDQMSTLLLEKETLNGEEFREALGAAPLCAPLSVELPATQPVAESAAVGAAVPVTRARPRLPAAEAVATSARVAKRLRLRPRSVIAAVGKQPGQLARKAAEVAGALKPRPDDSGELDLA